LIPVIELYHHTARASQYDEAVRLFRGRLAGLLYYRFGSYQIRIELLRELFPNGEDHPPRLKQERPLAWTLNALANSYGQTGQPHGAISVWQVALPLAEKLGEERPGEKMNLATGLRNLAIQQSLLGNLAAAEQSLRRSIALGREIKDELQEAAGHQVLGWLLAYQGSFDEAARELGAALIMFDKRMREQSTGVTWALRALLALLMGDAKAALGAARRARELANAHRNEKDIIRAEWLFGAAHRVLSHLSEAEPHLTEAVTRCRRINLVELESDILLEMARLRWAQSQRKELTSEESTRLQGEALRLAREALAIADRCEYRLKQADIHNFLAQVALDKGDREEARKHTEIARKRAWCDGPPHCYKPALEEAERLLELCRRE
jgi:tetratricopeptide (TPR) repeat protein